MKPLIVVLLGVLLACNTNPQQNATGKDTVVNTDIVIPEAPANEPVTDSVINVRFPQDSVSVTIKGKMQGIGHPITAYIPVKQGKQLIASIVPDDSLANIRFNQIFTPDGKADGPFGRDLKFKIQQQGAYKLIIGGNQMQEGNYTGDFLLKVRVE